MVTVFCCDASFGGFGDHNHRGALEGDLVLEMRGMALTVLMGQGLQEGSISRGLDEGRAP